MHFNKNADEHGMPPLHLSTYCAHHFTETTDTDVHNRLVQTVDHAGHVSALVLLHLSSAFNTIDHTILFEMLEKLFSL